MNTPLKKLQKPKIELDMSVLEDAGFSESGKLKFCAILQEVSNQLFSKAVKYGDAEKNEWGREITIERVEAASQSVFSRYNYREKSKYSIIIQIAECVCAAFVGVGGGHLTETWGIILFALALAVTVILVVVRMLNEKK